MGKKVKIINDDPILSKNFKYEKRKKTKQIEKAQSQEQKVLEAKKKRQLLEVEKKVDDQIQKVTTNMVEINRRSNLNKQRQKIFGNKMTTNQSSTNTYKSKAQEIVLKTSQNVIDHYTYHFQLKPKESQIVKEKKVSVKKKIQIQTQKQIKNMFAAQFTEQKEESQVIEQQENSNKKCEVYNLSAQLKKESQVMIEKKNFHVTNYFKKHQDILSKKTLENDDQDLNLSDVFIKGYFDHVFIQNAEEQKIQNFRKIVIDHSTQHLQRCMKEQRGRGFTNCKILIITPFFGDAKAIFDIIESKYQDYSFKNKERLDQLEDQNDFFRIGLKITRKQKYLTYFSHFDHAQIIVASPIGLKSIIGSQGDEKRQNSFISSVQIVYIDRASVLMMQNWTHLIQILKNINYMPKYESLKNNIDSIRESMLELKGRLYRQSIVFSQFNFPQLNGLKFNHFHNIQGSITSKPFYNKPPTSIKAQQHFYKIELKQARDDLQARFDYFKRKFWDDLHNKQSQTKVVIFTNSYFEYLKLKSFLEKVNASAQYICEHTSPNKIQSRVAKFNNDQFRILLLTERAYYFEICQIKKFHHVYFYSLPKNAFIYNEMIQSIDQNELQGNNVVSIYTKYDSLILQRLVGTIKAQQMARQYCINVSFVL